MSTNKHIYMTDLHFEHGQWMNELLFWEDEIVTFKQRLEELVQRWTDKEILAKIEHFQNQFIVHGEVIDTLEAKINKHEKELSHYAIEHPVAIDHVHFSDHSSLRDDINTQRNIYGDLKSDFFKFLAHAM